MGKKLVSRTWRASSHEGGDVDGAGNLLRGEAVVKVGAQTGRERHSGKQSKEQIDGVDPHHARPVAQDKLKSLSQKVGERALSAQWWPWKLVIALSCSLG